MVRARERKFTVRRAFCSSRSCCIRRTMPARMPPRPDQPSPPPQTPSRFPGAARASVSTQLALRPLRAGDFAEARRVADAWFGRPVGLTMHRLFFDQLGPSGLRAAAADDPDRMLGVLLGFASLAEPELAYIHFVHGGSGGPRHGRRAGALSRVRAADARRRLPRGCARWRPRPTGARCAFTSRSGSPGRSRRSTSGRARIASCSSGRCRWSRPASGHRSWCVRAQVCAPVAVGGEPVDGCR